MVVAFRVRPGKLGLLRKRSKEVRKQTMAFSISQQSRLSCCHLRLILAGARGVSLYASWEHSVPFIIIVRRKDPNPCDSLSVKFYRKKRMAS